VFKVVEMYVRLIQNSQENGDEAWTISRVPEKYRAEVQAIIEGGNTNG
jgi:hypothetical protein